MIMKDDLDALFLQLLSVLHFAFIWFILSYKGKQFQRRKKLQNPHNQPTKQNNNKKKRLKELIS